LGLDCGSSEIFLASRRMKYSVVDERNIPASVSWHRGPDEQDKVFDSRAQPLPLLSVLPKPLQQRCGSLISDYPEVFKCINHFFWFLSSGFYFPPWKVDRADVYERINNNNNFNDNNNCYSNHIYSGLVYIIVLWEIGWRHGA